jgi:hypothetical protein
MDANAILPGGSLSHGQIPLASPEGDHLLAEEHVMPLVTVKLAEGVFTEKQKHDMAASSPT